MTKRVRVTSPQTRLALQRKGRRSLERMPSIRSADIQASPVLFHLHRKVAIKTVVVLAASLCFMVITAVVLPPPFSWISTLLLPYPVLLTIAAVAVRQAEKLESDHVSSGHASSDQISTDHVGS